MSVTYNTYVVLGLKFPFSVQQNLSEDRQNEISDKYEDSSDEKFRPNDAIQLFVDGMGGSYVIVGRVIAKSDDDEGLDKPVVVNTFDLALKSNFLANEIANFMETEDGHTFAPGHRPLAVDVITFTHYR